MQQNTLATEKAEKGKEKVGTTEYDDAASKAEQTVMKEKSEVER